jgi:predicted hotdog family 3-hydroxylacyl-ACP dehydratase
MTEHRRLQDLLAHEPPMLLLTDLVYVEEGEVCCKTLVAKETPFVDENGNLPGWVGIELMAQTIAVWGGRLSNVEQRDSRIGFLLGTRKYVSLVESFPVGAELVVTATLVVRDGSMGVFQCVIVLEDNVVAKAQVNAFMPKKKQLLAALERKE